VLKKSVKKSVTYLIIASHCLTILPVYAGRNEPQAVDSLDNESLNRPRKFSQTVSSFPSMAWRGVQHLLKSPQYAVMGLLMLSSRLSPAEGASTEISKRIHGTALGNAELLPAIETESFFENGYPFFKNDLIGGRGQELAYRGCEQKGESPSKPLDMMFRLPVIITDQIYGIITAILGVPDICKEDLDKFLDRRDNIDLAKHVWYLYASSIGSGTDPDQTQLAQNAKKLTQKTLYDFAYFRNKTQAQETQDSFLNRDVIGCSIVYLQPKITIADDGENHNVFMAHDFGSINLNREQCLQKAKACVGDCVIGAYNAYTTKFAVLHKEILLQSEASYTSFYEKKRDQLNKIGPVTTYLLKNVLKEQFEAKYFLEDIDTLERMFLDFSSLPFLGGTGDFEYGEASGDGDDDEDYYDRGDRHTLFPPSQSEVTTALVLTQGSSVSAPVHVTSIVNSNSEPALNFGLVLGVAGIACSSAVIFYCVKKCTRQASHSGTQEGGNGSSDKSASSAQAVHITITQGGNSSDLRVNSPNLRRVNFSAPVGQGEQEAVEYSKVYEAINEKKFHNGVPVDKDVQYIEMKSLTYQNTDASFFSGGTHLEQVAITDTFPPIPPRSDSLPEVRAPLLPRHVGEEGSVLSLLSKKAAPLSTGQVGGEEPGYMPMDRAKCGYL
jgi:hypothetical protein